MTLNEIKHKFSISKPYTQLIYINIAVFIIVAVVNIVVTLGSFRPVGFSDVLQLSSDFSLFTKHFWTIISYMFVHISLLHLFFNMTCLYWFGQLFLMSFTGKQLIGIYILGGILGGAVYMLSYNYIPYFEGKIALLSGASASIMAIIVATALDMPNMPIRLLLVGSVKLKWLAVVTVLISVLGITSNNAGGEIAHIHPIEIIRFSIVQRNAVGCHIDARGVSTTNAQVSIANARSGIAAHCYAGS